MADLADKLRASVHRYREDRRGRDETAPSRGRGPEDFEETAAILEYEQGNKRSEAERLARIICKITP